MKRFKNIIHTVIVAASLTAAAQEKEIEGVKFPVKLNVDNNVLALNGAGVREKYFMDMYVCGLYLRTPSSDAGKIVSADEPSAMRLTIVSSLVSTKAMQTAVEEGFEKSTGENTAAIRKEIEAFKNAFADPITKGNMFEIVYVPGTGTTVSKNGVRKATIAGLPFKKAMLGIWLGNEPAQKDLKEAMLGK
jgi:hypothetical protein